MAKIVNIGLFNFCLPKWLAIICSFLLLLQKKRTKEKEARTEPQASSAKPNANFSQNGRPQHKPLRATVLAAVRTI